MIAVVKVGSSSVTAETVGRLSSELAAARGERAHGGRRDLGRDQRRLGRTRPG